MPPAMTATPGDASAVKLRRFKNDCIYAIAQIALWIARTVPLTFAMALGRLLGRCAWLFAVRERRRTLRNLQSAWPDTTKTQRVDLGRRSFEHLGITVAEIVRLPEVLRRAQFDLIGDSLQMLERAVKKGRGVIFVTAHLGNWELLGAFLAKAGTRAAVVTRPVYDARIDRLLQRVRGRVGLRSIARDIGHRRAIVQALRAGEAVGLMLDQHLALPGGAYLPFFGRAAWTLTAPFAYAARRHIPVVCGFLRRRAALRYEIELLAVPPEAAAANATLETAIRRAPEQWVWLHDRWRL